MIHGFTGSPHGMRGLALDLYKKGFTVKVPRLPGHGTSVADFETTDHHDWLAGARAAYQELAGVVKKVYLVGLSMGGILSTLLAHEFGAERLVLIAMPYHLPWASRLIPIGRLFMSRVHPPNENWSLKDPVAREKLVCYKEAVPLAQAWALHKLARMGREALPQVNAETLMIYSPHDDVIPPDSGPLALQNIGSDKKTMITVHNSNHALTLDYDYKIVYEEVGKFLKDKQ